MISRKIQTILILTTLVLSTFFAFPLVHRANATVSSCAAPRANCLFIDPPTKAAAAFGSTVTFNVKVASIDSFNAFDISVVTDFNTLTGVSISNPAAGTGVPGLGGTVFNTINCVEGLGPGCGINDGPGIVHFAVAYSTPSTAGGSGTLFQVSYTAGFGTGAILSPINAVIASSGAPVPISTASSVYGTPSPDFSASASSAVDQNGNPLQPGSQGQSVISVTSVGGFFDTVNLLLSPSNAVSDFISPTSVFVPAGGAAAATVSITVPLSTAQGTYHQTVTLTGRTTGVMHTADLAIVVSAPQNAALTCGSDISVVQGTTGANPVSISSQNGLFGGVFLSTAVAPGSGITATTDPASVSVGAGGSANAVLFVTAGASAPLGTSMVTLTGDFGGLAPSTCKINVTVLAAGTADFTVSSSDSSLIAIRGVTYTSTISVGNVNGFAGTVSTSVVVLPLVDHGPTISVSAASAGTASLTFLAPCSASGTCVTQLLTYNAVVIVSSGSQSHAVRVTYVLEDFGIQARGSHNFPEFDLTATQCETGKLSFGSLNGFTGVVKVTKISVLDIDRGIPGFPIGMTLNLTKGFTVSLTSGTFVAAAITLCTTADTPGGEYRLRIIGTTVVNGVSISHRKNIFIQLNSFDVIPDTNYLVVRQGTPSNTATVGITLAGSNVFFLCCDPNGIDFGTLPFLDFVALSVSVSPDPALTNTKLSVSITSVPQFTSMITNPTVPLTITVGAGGEGGLFAITVTGVAQSIPALHRSATIFLSIPSTIVQMPSFAASTSPGLATFTATVTNTGTTDQFVQVVCSVVSRTPGGSVYSPQSSVVALAAGATTTITFTQTTTAQDSGQLFNFLCGVNFSLTPDLSLAFVSKDKGKGTFTAS